MALSKSLERRLLDRQLHGQRELFVAPPELGWVRALRQSLGMSAVEMSRRLGVSPTRVRQLELAEIQQSLRLGQLHRLARALGCEFHYVLVPATALTEMVHRQALRKATNLIGAQAVNLPEGVDASLLHAAVSEEIHALALSLIDKHGLWAEDVDNRQ